MKRKIFTIIAMVVLTNCNLSVYAQRNSTERATFTYTRLPLTPLHEGIKTYEIKPVIVAASADDNREQLTARLHNAFNLYGYEKVVENGDIVFGLALSPSHLKAVYAEKIDKKEKKDDKEITVSYYYYNIEIRFPLSFTINDKVTKTTLSSGFVNNSNDYVYVETPKFGSPTERSKWWNSNKNEFIKNWKKDELNRNLGTVKERVENLYGYTPTMVYQAVYSASKRKVDYSDLDQAQQLALAAYKSVTAENGFNEEFNTQIYEAIGMWKKILTEYDESTKKARINKKVASNIHKNLANAYYWMGEIDQARDHRILQSQIDKSLIWSKSFDIKLQDRAFRLAGGKESADDFEVISDVEEADDSEEE
ncbi:MAG: hypothetical protein CVT98_08810 [Bacteroidetes bacterium HGW-Bacteroidetes-15]|nr:MAG: hypothetical protein CVT98_08810 [Bacteroidetes bacterium HGW-Bacteroidetes-15]